MRHLEVQFVMRGKKSCFFVFFFFQSFSLVSPRYEEGIRECHDVPGWAGQQHVGAGAVPVPGRICAVLGSAMLKPHHFPPLFSA